MARKKRDVETTDDGTEENERRRERERRGEKVSIVTLDPTSP